MYIGVYISITVSKIQRKRVNRLTAYFRPWAYPSADPYYSLGKIGSENNCGVIMNKDVSYHKLIVLSASPTSATGADVAAQSSTADAAELCEVCLVAPRSGVALVPCGHCPFCGSCADTVAEMDNGCPICDSPITMVLSVLLTETYTA